MSPFLHMLSHWLNSTALTHNAVTKDTHPQMWHLMVTLYLANSCMHTYSTLLHTEPCCVLSGRTQMVATWCVLMGSCDGFGQDMHTHTHTQMATHWEWPGDGRADYWFAQINDSQPGHLTMGKLHPQSWHRGLAHRAYITAFMQGASQVSFNPNSLLPEYIFKSLQICSNPWTNGFE